MVSTGMNSRLEAAIDVLDRANDGPSFGAAVLGLKEILEADHVVYHAVNHPSEEFAVASYSADWQRHYEAAGLTRIDPVVRGCLKSYGPVRWERLDWSSRKASRMFGDAVDAGVGNCGLSLPIRGPDGQFAVFTVSHCASEAEWSAQIEDLVTDAILISHFLNQKALDLVGSSIVEAPGELSPREADALALLATGMNRSQAADFLGISEHTLRVYIENARLKLGANNTVHAIAKGMSMGLVSI